MVADACRCGLPHAGFQLMSHRDLKPGLLPPDCFVGDPYTKRPVSAVLPRLSHVTQRRCLRTNHGGALVTQWTLRVKPPACAVLLWREGAAQCAARLRGLTGHAASWDASPVAPPDGRDQEPVQNPGAVRGAGHPGDLLAGSWIKHVSLGGQGISWLVFCHRLRCSRCSLPLTQPGACPGRCKDWQSDRNADGYVTKWGYNTCGTIVLQVLREKYPQFAELSRTGQYAQQDAEECWIQLMYSLRERVQVQRRTSAPGRSQPMQPSGTVPSRRLEKTVSRVC